MRIDFPNVNGTIEVYMDCMRAICGDTRGKSMIDLGCCFAPNTPRLGFEHRLYVDTLPRKLDHPEEQQYFVQCDILDVKHAFISHQFDVAIASDVIEHLTVPNGHQLIRTMEHLADKQILFTPTTEIFKMVGDDNHNPEEHRSLWKPDDFPGYAAIVFPHYHQVWNGGAFFVFNCVSVKYHFDRVVTELKSKSWAT